MIEAIKELLKAVWNFIKKIFLKILNFAINIRSWFKTPERLQKMKENANRIAVVIKEKLDNGEYNVINCLYDKEENELVDYQEDTLSIEAEELDKETERNFGNKDMIVLN